MQHHYFQMEDLSKEVMSVIREMGEMQPISTEGLQVDEAQRQAMQAGQCYADEATPLI